MGLGEAVPLGRWDGVGWRRRLGLGPKWEGMFESMLTLRLLACWGGGCCWSDGPETGLPCLRIWDMGIRGRSVGKPDESGATTDAKLRGRDGALSSSVVVFAEGGKGGNGARESEAQL